MVPRVKQLAHCGVALLASMVLGLCEASAQQPADVPHGRTLYVAHCGRCHGMDGGFVAE